MRDRSGMDMQDATENDWNDTTGVGAKIEQGE